jgi:diadenylate cyclase
MDNIFDLLKRYTGVFRWQDTLDIIVVSFLIYKITMLVKGTRAVQMVMGLGVIIVIYFVARTLQLYALHWLLGTVLSSVFILVVILFQEDIRRVLIQVGQNPFLSERKKTHHDIEEILKTLTVLSKEKTGAIIVIEREVGLGNYLESGTNIDSQISRELLSTIFYKGTPLHDGAVVIQKGKISFAGCLLPLSLNTELSKRLGTRHRAAIGITEETDAVAMVVSEETGGISMAISGKITRNLEISVLRNMLYNLFAKQEETKAWWLMRR